MQNATHSTLLPVALSTSVANGIMKYAAATGTTPRAIPLPSIRVKIGDRTLTYRAEIRLVGSAA